MKTRHEKQIHPEHRQNSGGKDKLTGRIRSFVMIFIGSYDYLKKTKSMGKTLTSTGSPISMVRYCSMKSTEHSLTDGSTKKGK